jgi:hypothetical protein
VLPPNRVEWGDIVDVVDNEGWRQWDSCLGELEATGSSSHGYMSARSPREPECGREAWLRLDDTSGNGEGNSIGCS